MSEKELQKYQLASVNDRRLWPWLSEALINWGGLLCTMGSSLHFIHITNFLPFQLAIFIMGMWLVGIFQYRLAILGHDAGHRTISKNQKINDLIANIFVGQPLLIGLKSYRLFHNEGHHPKINTGTLQDPEIVNKVLEGYWSLPMSRKKIVMRFIRNLFGSNIPHGLGFIFMTCTPKMFIRMMQFMEFGLLKNKKMTAHILPKSAKNISNATSLIILDTLWGITILIFKLVIWVLVIKTVMSFFQYSQWWLIIIMWLGAFGTSFWAAFNLRMLFEHVGTNTMQIQEPSMLWKFFVFPHNIWAHQLHHQLAGLPFHRLKKVLRMREALGVSIQDVFMLLATSEPIPSGFIPAEDSELNFMNRATKDDMLKLCVSERSFSATLDKAQKHFYINRTTIDT